MNAIFDWCVELLMNMSRLTGLTYKEINVWLFVIIHPLITVFFFALYLKYKRLYRNEALK